MADALGLASFGFVLFLLCRPDTVPDAIANCREAEQICYLFDVHSDCQQPLRKAVSSLQSSYRRLWSVLRGAPGEFEMLLVCCGGECAWVLEMDWGGMMTNVYNKVFLHSLSPFLFTGQNKL